MPQDQMPYACLKCILMHMEANKRFELSARIPSIRNAERHTPLKINNLYLSPSFLSINDTHYTLGVLRIGTNLAYFEKENDSGGSMDDVDQFGIWDRMDSVRTPGDIVVTNRPVWLPAEQWVNQLPVLQHRITQLKSKWFLSKASKDRLDIYEAQFYLGNLHQNNTPFPHKMCIQFSTKVTGKTGNLRTERLEYKDKKLYEAMKYLSTKLLGNRPHTVHVKHLHVHNVGVLRLPEGLTLKIREIDIPDNVFSLMESLEAIVHPNSFPLNSISIRGGIEFGFLDGHKHISIQSAENVFLRQIKGQNNGSWGPILLETQNKLVHISNGGLTRQNYISLVDKIIEDQRVIGTKFVISVSDFLFTNSVMSSLGERHDAELEWNIKWRFIIAYPFEICIKMPAESSRLRIRYENNRTYANHLRHNYLWSPWQLVMAVEPLPEGSSSLSSARLFSPSTAITIGVICGALALTGLGFLCTRQIKMELNIGGVHIKIEYSSNA